MHNKKIIAKGLILGAVISATSVNSIASYDSEYNLLDINDNLSSLNKNKIKKENKVEKSIDELKVKRVINSQNMIIVNENIVEGSVLEISLADGEFVSDLSGNPDGYETIRVTTTGNKKLVKEDYDNLRLSEIPKVDLSNAFSDFIPAGAFSNATWLTEFKFPKGITSIGGNTSNNGAFYNCSNLTGNLIIPDTVTNIGSSAFSECSGLTGNLVIPDSVTSIGGYAFSRCSGLTGDLIIPNSVTSIGSFTFDGCTGLNGNLVIPDSVTSIGSYAFRKCSGFTGNLVIPDSVTSIGNNTFSGCSGFTGNLVIPDSVTNIGSDAFYGCNNIEKIIVKIDETHTDIDYRRSIIEKLPLAKTYIEMSYNFDITGTWLETTTYTLARPTLSTYVGAFENNEGIGVSLEVLEASDIKTISITKDGLSYDLDKSENDKYMFNESGNYEIYIETELGTISNILFKNTSPMLEPSLEYKDNNINIINNGILSNTYVEKENTLEDFNNIDDLKYGFSNSNWIIENGILKSEAIGHSSKTENEFIVNAEVGDKIQINVKTSSENSYDWGYIYINGVEVYKKSGTSNGFEIIEYDLIEGENIIKFMYQKDISGSSGDDAMFIDYIKVLKNEIATVNCDTLEYRINGGEWQTYTDAFELNYPVGTKLQLEVRARHDGFVSSILKQEITVELNTRDIEDAIDKAEQSKDMTDINDARDLVNNMPESSKKDEFQDRLNDIFPDLTLESKNATANLDLYIKSENMLLLSLNTNSVTFEDFSGVEDVESLNAVNLTVNSSLPYKINAYLATEIQNADKSKTMDKDILNIKANGESNYNTFVDTSTPIVLLDDQPADNNVSHGIDLMLKGNIAHEKDIYKTVIKFEAEQK